MSKIQLTVVIPIYNEEEVIDDLFQGCTTAFKKITNDFEIICVDDGSTDNSLQKLMKCHEKDNHFKVLILSRNFGHQAAYTAGLRYAQGDYIAMMDGDFQDPPELLIDMYEKLTKENIDLIYGKRIGRKEKILKKCLIKSFHYIFRKVFKQYNADSGNFSMLNRAALNALLSFEEKNRYLPGLRALIGFKQGYVEYSRSDRKYGEAKMTFSKLFRLSFDAFFSFSDLPIKICFFSGLIGIVLFFIAIVYALISKYFIGIAPFGWSSTLLSIYLLASIQLLFLGIIGEYIHRIYKEIQNRPIFIVKDFIG